MATKRTYWECRFCQHLYDDEEQASECEKHHTELSGMQVIDSDHSGTDSTCAFPEKILIKNDGDDEHLAEYTLGRQGSIADFYQSGGPWYQAPDDNTE